MNMSNACSNDSQSNNPKHQYGRFGARRAFTLMELMVVVVIIGILAALATYSVNNYLQYVKISEPREIIGEIMSAQEALFDETSRYLDVTGGVSAATDFYPYDPNFDATVAIQWGAVDACTGNPLEGGPAVSCQQNFDTLGIFVNKPVLFRYGVTVVAAGNAPPLHSSIDADAFNPSDVVSARDGYVAIALGDLDGDSSKISAVVGSNLQAELYIEDAGQ